jgi:hypothetical protein
MAMSNATSIVGQWTAFVAWGDAGPPVNAGIFTFESDGSWSYQFGGGRWIQVEGLAFWNFTNAAGLVYTANVTRNAVDGIMGYAVADSNPGSGSFYAVRETGPAAAAAVPRGHDIVTGPHKA